MPVIPCTTTPPVMGIVTFDPAAFVVVYPEFAGFITDPGPPAVAPLLSNDFAIATLLLNNTCASLVKDANQREYLLNLLTAHVAYMLQGTNDGAGNITPPPGIVGRVNTATEGAVSVGAEFDAPPNANQAYFIQSKYGALYWTLTARYRTFHYVPPCDANGYGPLGYDVPTWGGCCG